jgi:hypothetical protein
MTTDAFNLRDVLRDAAASTTDPHPAAVAEAAFDAIDQADRAVALRQALDMLAGHYVMETRPTRRSGTRSRGKRRVTGSRLAALTRSFLDSREFSPFRGDWIMLRQATAEDLRSMAESRFKQAEQNMEKGDWYERCAKEVSEHGVETFGELPEEVVESLMPGAEPDEDAEAAE